VDADTGFGPLIPVGDPVTWTYVVTNTGNTTLESLVVTDSDIGAIVCPDTIPIDGSVTCTATGTAGPGLYENMATASAVDTLGNPVSDSDPSHYYGAATGIDVEKSTNGEDADEPFGPGIPVGDPVTWTYTVALPATATVPVENVVLSDDVGTPGVVPGVLGGDDILPVFTGGDTDGDSILDLGETWTYQATGVATAGQYVNFATVTADSVFDGTQVIDNDPSHYFGVISDVTIVKYTNGADANDIGDPDVPVLRTGGTVDWTYVVTNEGNTPIISWTVSDDQVGAVACTRSLLLPGRSAICHASGTVQEGPYTNVATVTGTDVIGTPVTDSDPSNYIGVTPELTIEKATNTDDADEPTGPFIPVGQPVTWDYVVENTGSADLSDLVVVDLRISGGPAVVTCDDTDLPVGASTNCQATGISVPGQFRNLAIALAQDPFGEPVGDFDPSHYFGAEAGITLEKYTNGIDGDEPTGALIPVGGAVEWSYVVSNTGNTGLSQIELSDDQIGAVACPAATLAVGASMTCTAAGIAQRGQYANLATVTAIDGAAQTVSDSDPSHYFGYLLQIDVEKSTNGEDADTLTGPYIPVGDPVTWTYVVTNPGDYHLGEVSLTDDQGVTPVFQGGDANSDGFLDPGETWVYEATGSAVAGQYANTATAQGTAGNEFDSVLTDSDPSHYFGLVASIDIQKTPDVAVVQLGASHTFDITVTNISNVVLSDVVVTDPVTPSCDRAVGSMTPGEAVTYSCDVTQVMNLISNVAFVEGLAPDGTAVSDDDPAAVSVVGAGGTSAIGDTVWTDSNRNGVQDNGEDGISGARVIVELDSDSVTEIPLAATISTVVTTDADGEYLLRGLVPGDYTVRLDRSSVSGALTTPAVYSFTLGLGEVRLDADFGLVGGSLPFTGAIGIAAAALLAGVLVFLGRLLLLSVRRRAAAVTED
jgi:uncharacterized repeat protein (TIGR01451 family)